MNVLIQLVHPAHFYYYRDTIKDLKSKGHRVILAIITKDMLEDIVQAAGVEYVNICPNPLKGKYRWGMIYDMIIRDLRMIKLALRNRVDVISGSTVESAHVGWLLRKPNINIGEDDAYIVPKYTNNIAPFVDVRLSPYSCDNGKIEHKSVHFPGFWKLAYLHPNRFTPSIEKVKQYGIDTEKPYFLLRFSALNAHHDKGIKGISTEIAQRIIDILSPHGQIYITSERKLEQQFEPYRIKINPLDIHHVMASATLYIGDSQSMAVEASMLGVPALRFNDFVGKKKIGVMGELEHVYGLTYGISSHEPQQLYDKIQELIAIPNLREEFQARRQRMLDEKIDVTAFLTWFLENYPASAVQHVETDDFWKQFK
jgi:predicted glycosyltransferase